MNIRVNGTDDEILAFVETIKRLPEVKIKQISKLYLNRRTHGYDVELEPTTRCYIELEIK